MRFLVAIIGLLWATSVGAATYTYVGATYATTTGFNDGPAAGSYVLRGPYDNSMRISGSLTFVAPLSPNLSRVSYESVTDIDSPLPCMTAYSFFDGINSFGATSSCDLIVEYDTIVGGAILQGDLTISTDHRGRITEWAMRLMVGSSDYNLLEISNVVDPARGFDAYNRVGYTFEYLIPGCTNDPFCYGYESFWAQASAPGVWIGPVPLPPSALLLGAGLIGMFGFAARARRVPAIVNGPHPNQTS